MEDMVMRLLATICFLPVFSIAHAQQTYPNIDGEVLLDDDRVVVQRFVLEPGQWEGIHEHPEHQLVIVLKNTDELTFRFGGAERVFTGPEDENPEAMDVFWRPGPVSMSDQHDSGNTGTRPLEWIAITFKSDSVATDNPPAQFVDPID
jgi:predicted metal-dependent enzyme (double-stranded beta helix superfamily)